MGSKHAIVRLTGMWLAALAGAFYGLVFTIIGAAADWGPGSGMEGPYWKIFILGLLSLLIGAYIGETIVRKLSKMVFKKSRPRLEVSMLMFLCCAIATWIAWIISWETGYIAGILMQIISWRDPFSWMKVIFDVALMSAIYGFPVMLCTGIINAIVTWVVLRK